jgi:hypothetical protein
LEAQYQRGSMSAFAVSGCSVVIANMSALLHEAAA